MHDGTYNNVVVVSAELIESKEKRTPGVELLFQLSESDGGEQIRGTLWLSSGAFNRSIESLRHTGWEGNDLSDLRTAGGKLCQIVVETEDYNGKGYPRVKWVNANESAGLGGQGKMDDSARKAFASKMKGAVIAASKGQPVRGGAPKATAPVATRQPPQSQPDDDLTF